MEKFFDREYKVNVRDTDLFDMCRPSSLLNFFQDVAGAHVDAMGCREKMETDTVHAIWMLVRVRYELYRPIRGKEKIRVRTYHRPTKGVFVYRDYEIWSGDALAGRCASVWVIADYVNHSLLNAELVLGTGEDTALVPARTEKLGKIRFPEGLRKTGAHRMGYSETDMNGHVNNIRYADFACDAIRFENMRGKYIKAMQITYSAECLPGQMIDVLSVSPDGEKYFVRGLDENGTAHFDVLIETAEIEG
jgi:medium-chain acyl-[acyl-carrier-protein] hydrolase